MTTTYKLALFLLCSFFIPAVSAQWSKPVQGDFQWAATTPALPVSSGATSSDRAINPDIAAANTMQQQDVLAGFVWSDHWPGLLFVIAVLLVNFFLLWVLRMKNRQLSKTQDMLTDILAEKDAILSAVPELMYELDEDGRYHNVWARNPGELTASKSALLGRTVEEMLPAQAAQKMMRALQEAARTGQSCGQRICLQTVEGERWFELSTSIKNSDESPLRFIMLSTDITERHENEQQLRLAASVFNHSQEGIIITDRNNNILNANPACSALTGYTREELIGRNPSIFSSGQHSDSYYHDMWHALEHNGHWQGEILNRKKSGETYTELLGINRISDEQGELQYYVAVFSDLSYLKSQEQALQKMAYSDALTGLPNRLLLHDRMEHSIRQVDRQKSMMAVCYLDLDGFKPVNDQFGHEVGDQILMEVARRLKQVLREEDTIARLGGDEFVLLVQDVKNVLQLEQMLERVLLKISRPYATGSAQPANVSASIGIAIYPLDDADPDTLLRHADQAMYQAKQQGKNCFSFFDSEEEKRAVKNQRLHREIEQALENDEFELDYQPKVNMRSGEVLGAEALIRWNHPEKGRLFPVEFLPPIERSLLIAKVGEWVLRSALRQLQALRAEGCELKLSINIAALHIQQADFVKSIRQILDEYSDISASDIEFEILETAALENVDPVIRVMRECRTLGIRFALDDFGTGYSSLTYLRHLPVQVIKIDQSFVRDVLENREDAAITEGIISLARAFGRSVIAEGVESVEHGRVLLAMGCELGQGYGIARPMPAEQLAQWRRQFKADKQWKQLRKALPS